jgi:hypothetical protein
MNSVHTGKKTPTVTSAMEDVAELLRPHWHILNELSAAAPAAAPSKSTARSSRAPAKPKTTTTRKK